MAVGRYHRGVRPRAPLAAGLLAVGLLAAAAAAVGAARADDPETARWVEWHRERALRLRAQGLWAEASEEWAAISWLTPSDPHTAIQAAVETVEAGALPPRVFQPEDPAYKRADALVLEAVKRGGTHDGALAYAVGRLKLAARDWPTAYTMLHFAQDHGFDRVRARYWFFIAAVNRTPALLDDGKADEAVKNLEALIREMPEHPHRLAAEVNLATSYRYRQEHLLSESVLRTAIARRPEAAKPWDVLGQVFADQQRLDEAIDAFRRAADLAAASEDSEFGGSAVLADALRHAATVEIRRGRLDEGERLAQRLLEVRRDDPEGVALLGMAAYARGGEEEVRRAVVHLRRAARLDPTDVNILSRLAEALYTAREDAEADHVKRKVDELRAKEAAKPVLGTMEKRPEK